jgi:cytochrome o ubiquinol oxidase subunit 3
MNKAWQDKTYFGFWLYILSDCLLFAALFASYAVLRTATAAGPGPEELLNLPFVFVETVVLLASNLFVGLALVAKNKKSVVTLLLAALVLGLVFLGLEAREFATLIAEGHGPSTSAFLSSFFGLVGTHGLHVALGSLWMIVVMAHVWTRGVHESSTKLRLLGIFWHFLDIVWIFIFSVVYLLSAAL